MLYYKDMWKKTLIIALLLIVAIHSRSQVEVSGDTSDITMPEAPGGFIFKPTLGLGVGMFTFYGDISKKYKTNHPIVSRIGYDLRVTQNLSPSFDLSFYILFGKLGANERSLTRNLNFESKITTGGVALSYNFNGLLKEDRIIDPYISAGFESFEFLSKTDLVDAYGNTYNYWSDGSIRNIDENDPNSENAIRIQRDYAYESDIRELDIDSFGKYQERSWAFPIGIGVNLRVTDKIQFRIGTAMHFALTDYVDGVTGNSIGERGGDKANDMFLFTSFNLNYNLVRNKKIKSGLNEDDFDDVDFLALEMGDSDGDGVIDFEDECANTPDGVKVDEKGCPLDDDGDGVPNYADLEPNSPDSAVVNADGIAMTDSLLELAWLHYADSTGMFGKITRTVHEAEKTAVKQKKKYKIQIGEYTEGIPPELADIYLSIPDIKTIEQGNTTIFIVGDYDNLPDAVKRQLELAEKGIPDPLVVTNKKDSGLVEVDVSHIDIGTNTTYDVAEDVLFRVQLGAFSRKLSYEVFHDIPEVIAIPSNDGLTRYYTGSFKDINEASKRKIEMMMNGFEGAFVVPFKGSKRITLKEAGATAVDREAEKEISKVKHDVITTSVNKDKIKFKVQIGSYQNKVPTNVLEKYMALGNVQQKVVNGETKYLVGNFSDYQQAQAFKLEVVSKGIGGAFVVGEFNNNLISAQEAMELLKQ